MKVRPNILVICGKNKRRSRTAEFIFKNDDRFNIRSAGLSPESDHRVNLKDIERSDLIVVMERKHRSRLYEMFQDVKLPEIEILNIEDDYDFNDPELSELLKDGINIILEKHYGL